MAARLLHDIGRPVDGLSILDVGCGSGTDSAVLGGAGADVVGIDLTTSDLRHASPGGPLVCGDGRQLPFPSASFDAVICSNVLEHTPGPDDLLREMVRVVRPGGWLWVSWTNWYSPVGGHEIIGLHYLGPRVGPALWRRLAGEPSVNRPGDGLWPTHIGPVLRSAEDLPGARLIDVHPRYYPSQRWIARVPIVREVAMWNCVLVFDVSGTDG